jgi:hypothetical protein
MKPLDSAASKTRAAEAKQLADRIGDAAPVTKESGLAGVVAFSEAVGQPAEPFLIPLMPEVLRAVSDKVRTVHLAG